MCQTQAFILLEALLGAILYPSNQSNIKQLLVCPLLAVEHTRLFDHVMLDAVSVIMHELKSEWKNRGLGAVLDKAMHANLVDGQSILVYLTKHSLSQDYIDWMQLCELLLAEEAQRIYKPAELFKFLQKIKNFSPDLHPKLRRRGQCTDSAVSIMTTHMSKGLEFDVVFALGMGCRTINAEYCPEKEAEKMRLFYVALTRAKRRVYVPLLPTYDDKPELGTASPSELFFGRFTHPLKESLAKEIKDRHISLEVLDASISIPQVKDRPIPDLKPPDSHGLSYSAKLLTSYSKLVKPELPHAIAAPSNSDAYNLYTLPMGAQTGTVLHELIEAVIERGYYRCNHLSQLDGFVSRYLEKTHLFSWKQVIQRLVQCLFQISIDGFCLKDVEHHSMAQEMEFLFPLESNLVVKGFADLIFQHQGKYYLVDWKSNYLGDTPKHYDREHLEGAMQEHDYHLQARLYSAALLKWIGVSETEAPKNLFGGAIYIFLRGIDNEDTHGVYNRKFE